MFITQIIKDDAEAFKSRAAENLLLALYKLEEARYYNRDVEASEAKYLEALAIERAVTAITADSRAVSADVEILKAWVLTPELSC